ncbi:MAG: outer membrane beta-barrel protein, partial [Ferruginibacter sp.]
DIALHFIELPLNIIYSLPAGPGRFSVGAGPNVSFGISGKDKYSYITSGSGFPTQSDSGEEKIKFDGKKAADLPASDNDIHFKALDFGANAVAGYKLDMGLFFNVGYTFGFSNLNPNPNSSLKTGGLTLKVGYIFGGNSSTED